MLFYATELSLSFSMNFSKRTAMRRPTRSRYIIILILSVMSFAHMLHRVAKKVHFANMQGKHEVTMFLGADASAKVKRRHDNTHADFALLSEISWKFNQSEYLNFTRDCLLELDSIWQNVPDRSHWNKVYAATRIVLASGISGDILYVYSDAHTGDDAFSPIEQILQISEVQLNCGLRQERRRKTHRVRAQDLHASEIEQNYEKYALIFVECNIRSSLLAFLINLLKQSGQMIGIMHEIQNLPCKVFQTLPIHNIDGMIYTKPVTLSNFHNFWDALMMSSMTAMEIAGSRKSFQGMGHVGEVRMELQALSQFARSSAMKHFCEVGFNAGHSALAFLSFRSDSSLTSFDLGILPWSAAMAERINKLFPGRFNYVKGNSSVTVRQYAENIARNEGQLCDLFFVNGAQSYQLAKLDFENALEVMSDNGVLIADDHSSSFTGVVRAWDEVVKSKRVLPFLCTHPTDTFYGYDKGWCVGRKNSIGNQMSSKEAKNAIYIATTQCGVMPSAMLELEVLAKSLVMASTPYDKIVWYIISDDEARFHLRKMFEIFVGTIIRVKYLSPSSEITLFKRCSMERLFLPALLPSVHCILYLDRDSLIVGGIREIYENSCQLVEKNFALGVTANASPWYPNQSGRNNSGVTYVPNTGINAGILAMNLDRLREMNFTRSIMDTIPLVPNKSLGDQDLLNYYFADRVSDLKLLDCRFNARVRYSKQRAILGHVECDCVSMISDEDYRACKRVSSIDDAFILHGNRGAFHSSDEHPLSKIWKRYLSVQVEFNSRSLISITLPTYQQILQHYIG